VCKNCRKKKATQWGEGGGDVDPEVMYNLCFILKVTLQKLSRQYQRNNIFWQLRLYTYKYNCMFRDSLTYFKSQGLFLIHLI
jgi:hypothetical protein